MMGALTKVFCHYLNPTNPNKLNVMKAIIKRPFQRHFLVLLSLLAVSGCSGIQSNPVYQSWEERAYNAYNISVPSANKPGILPALLRTVALPGRQFLRNPSIQRVSYQKSHQPPRSYSEPVRTSTQELDFIEQNYGL